MPDKDDLRKILCPDSLIDETLGLLGKLDVLGEKDWYHLEPNARQETIMQSLRDGGLVQQGCFETEKVYRITPNGREMYKGAVRVDEMNKPVLGRVDLSKYKINGYEKDAGQRIYVAVIEENPLFEKKYAGIEIWIHPQTGNFAIGEGLTGAAALRDVVGHDHTKEFYSRQVKTLEQIPMSAMMRSPELKRTQK